jgi:hypothetical protein
MTKVRVVAPMGATIRGPAVIGLTPDQHSRRVAVLGKVNRKGVYTVPGGASISFKLGEEFEIEGVDRLNRALFEDLDALAEAEAAAAAAISEAAAAAEIAGGADAQPAAVA